MREQGLKARVSKNSGQIRAASKTASQDATRFRVSNLVRDKFLFADVTVVDTTTIPLRTMIEGMGRGLESWLWLKPYRGIPMSPGSLPFDLVYLDDNNRVIKEVESYPHPDAMLLRAQPASALLLPAHTVFASQIRPGDQLTFRDLATPRRLSKVPFDADGPDVARKLSAKSEPEFRPLRSLSTRAFKQAEVAAIVPQKEPRAETDPEQSKKESFKIRFLRWLAGSPLDRRSGSRRALPGLIVYYFTGGAPSACYVADISNNGFFLLSDDRPMLGTTILMTLQRTEASGDSPEDSICVFAKVVRWGPDGIGLEFVLGRPNSRAKAKMLADRAADKRALEAFLQRLSRLPQRQ